jgi:hypothetical protein
MIVLFVSLAVISLLTLLGGIIWGVVASGRTRRRSGPQVGAEIMRDGTEGEGSGGAGIFIGKGVSVEGEVDVSLGDLKRAWRAGRKDAVAPFLLAWIGLEGLLFFSGFALLVAAEEKLIGLLLLAMGLVALWMIGSQLRRA